MNAEMVGTLLSLLATLGVAWLLTYAVLSTVLIGSVWLAERGEQREERPHHPGVHRPPRFPPRPSAWAMSARTLSRSPGRTLPASSR